jgi:hypothetical protein
MRALTMSKYLWHLKESSLVNSASLISLLPSPKSNQSREYLCRVVFTPINVYSQ